MIISLKHKKIIFIIVLIILIIISFIINKNYLNKQWFLSGEIYNNNNKETIYCSKNIDEDYNEVYHRPSKKEPVKNNYSLSSFVNNPKINNSEELILAYFGILKEASNMDGYSGGCGSIGDEKKPYPYAYNLLSNNYKNKMSLKQFENSFKGIGHITLLSVS